MDELIRLLRATTISFDDPSLFEAWSIRIESDRILVKAATVDHFDSPQLAFLAAQDLRDAIAALGLREIYATRIGASNGSRSADYEDVSRWTGKLRIQLEPPA